jgi:hypothetical protein
MVATTVLYPIHRSVKLVDKRSSNSLGLRVYAQGYEATLWKFLEPRTAGIRYELAVDEPLALAPLIIHDQRPVIPLTSFKGIPAVGLQELKASVDTGQVRYALIGAHTCQGPTDKDASCVAAALWVRRHGIDVSAGAGITGAHRLYQLLPS